tara:strand:- start:157 stop:408 length:252 start_codon:yes stop_codon:yes gene_type:complete
MMELIQGGEVEFVFAGENGSVLASPEITKEIYKLDHEDQLWKALQKDTTAQNKAIHELRDKLSLRGYTCELTIEDSYFYLIIR